MLASLPAKLLEELLWLLQVSQTAQQSTAGIGLQFSQGSRAPDLGFGGLGFRGLEFRNPKPQTLNPLGFTAVLNTGDITPLVKICGTPHFLQPSRPFRQ